MESKAWGKDNFTGSDKREKLVAVLKPENFGKEMSVDEKNDRRKILCRNDQL